MPSSSSTISAAPDPTRSARAAAKRDTTAAPCNARGARHDPPLLVGDNASGKTSVLEALELQARIADDPVWLTAQAALLRDWQRRGSDTSGGVIAIATDGECSPADGPLARVPWNTRIELSVDENPYENKPRGHARLTGQQEQRPISTEIYWNFAFDEVRGESGWGSIGKLFGVTKLFRLDAAAIAAAAYSDAAVVPIETDGTNTAVALAAMKLADDDAFQRIERDLRQIVPSVERVRLNRVKVQHPTAEGLRFEITVARVLPYDLARLASGVAVSVVAGGVFTPGHFSKFRPATCLPFRPGFSWRTCRQGSTFRDNDNVKVKSSHGSALNAQACRRLGIPGRSATNRSRAAGMREDHNHYLPARDPLSILI